MTTVTEATEHVMRYLDGAAAPGNMSQEDALAFYEGVSEAVATEIAARIDGLMSDLGA